MTKVKAHDNPYEEIDTETCIYCTGNSVARRKDGTLMTSKEWCTEVGTCSATIEWDKVFNGKAP